MAKVLIIEDEGSLLALYSDLLESEGHTVYKAADGDVGLNLARTTDWEVMLLDIMLPNMDGVSLLKTLKAENKLTNRRVYVFSNLSGSELVSECLKNGATAHLSKAETSPEHILNIISPVSQTQSENNI